VSAGRLERAARAGVTLAAALAVSGCPTREISVTPFHLTVDVEGQGPLSPPAADPPVAAIAGAAHLEGDATLAIVEPGGPTTVRIAFDPAGRAVRFPAALEGTPVTAYVLVTDQVHAPDGTPLPYPGLAVVGGSAGNTQFMLGEADLVGPDGLAGVPLPLGAFSDGPEFEVFADDTEFEATSCGLAYYDLLRVFDRSGGTAVLRFGGQTVMAVDAAAPWQVLHVMSFHRVNCSSRTPVWTQLAAWRTE